MTTALVDAELAKLDPTVPFRASSFQTHHTWAQTFHSRPELYIRPQTLPEIQKLVNLARRCRRRLVVVGCGHSPSNLTCSSAWMVNLDHFNEVLGVDEKSGTVTVQAGIRLRDLNLRAKDYGLTMRNLGSIHDQSIAGAIATATHGSSLRHGLLSQSVRSLRIVLANGSVVRCSSAQNLDLFRAALVSLGGLGIIVEVEFEMVPQSNVEWKQMLQPLSYVLDNWNGNLWTRAEFVRVWWLPYMKRAIVWEADRTSKPVCTPAKSWYGAAVGFHTYQFLLWMANKIPRILPTVEWFVFGMQYGFRTGACTTAVEEQRTGLLMDCLYSQFVNEWAIPLRHGPEALRRFSAWINHDQAASGIPFSPKGLYIHAPIEVRVSDTSSTSPRPFLDNTAEDEPTLYLNATLYRPYHQDPPCRARYYEAFEWLMKQLGGRPHWAKNFATVTHEDFKSMYGDNLDAWLRVRDEVDPDGLFVGAWHRENLLHPEKSPLPLEELEVGRRRATGGGSFWFGEQARRGLTQSSSEESFDIMQGAEAESQFLRKHYEDEDN